MPMPVRNLPMVQWDCHGCTDCCRTYAVRVTTVEKARIEAQDWSDTPDLAGVPRTVYEKRIQDDRLNHRADGACIFLGPDNRCRMHAKFGAASKPAACRIYPFTFAPAGDHWRVGLRLACPSALENKGRAISGHSNDLRDYTVLLEAEQTTTPPVPALVKGTQLPWQDLLRFVDVLRAILAEPGKPMERKLREVLALSALCRKSVFDKVTGPRLTEYLTILRAAVEDDIPAAPHQVARPGWTARTVFRQVAALYTRKDHGPDRGILPDRGWAGRFAAGFRFALGRGRVPRLHGAIPATARFDDAERPGLQWNAGAEELLRRFFTLKVESLAFFGPPNFHLPFWDGLDTLILTFPSIVWLARLIAVDKPPEEALRIALRTVDDNFGFNPLLGSRKQVWALSMLAARGDLPRLVAWFGRSADCGDIGKR